MQIDSGIVWAQVIVGDTVYAGGSFSNARPAGAAPGHEPDAAQQHPRLQHHHRRGHLVRPADQRHGQGHRGLARRQHALRRRQLHSVNGQTRFNVAAFDTATGALSTTFKPAIGGSYVNAIVATNSTVYFGGLIGAAGGVTRKNLAAVPRRTARCSAGLRPPTCRSTAWCSPPAGDKLIVGGRFGTVNNVSQRGLAALDLATGATPAVDRHLRREERPRRRRSQRRQGGHLGARPPTPTPSTAPAGCSPNKSIGNLEGIFSAEPGNGAIRWIADCHGDHYGVYSDGTNVYSTSHEHDCQTAGGMPQARPRPGNMHNATVYTAAAKGTLRARPTSTPSTPTGAATPPPRP